MDGHTPVCWLESQATYSLNPIAIVQPPVEITDGDNPGHAGLVPPGLYGDSAQSPYLATAQTPGVIIAINYAYFGACGAPSRTHGSQR